jgi:hypothetical protein
MDEFHSAQKNLAAKGILEKHGIIVDGTPNAVSQLGKMLSLLPVGRAMVLFAEMGRKYGVRLRATPAFDEVAFLHEMKRYGMTQIEVQCFARNLGESTEPHAAKTPNTFNPLLDGDPDEIASRMP